MTVPRVYRRNRENTITSFDWVDTATGVGYVDYNGFSSRDNTTISYHLTNGTPWSDTIETTANQSDAGSSTKDIDLDFDLNPFTVPVTIEGDVITQFSSAIMASATTTKYFMRLRVRRVRGGVESELGTSRNQEITHADGGDSWKSASNTFAITLTQTDFKIGDILRVTVEGWIQDGNTSCELGFSHSPKNQAGTAIDPAADANQLATHNTFVCSVPYKITL